MRTLPVVFVGLLTLLASASQPLAQGRDREEGKAADKGRRHRAGKDAPTSAPAPVAAQERSPADRAAAAIRVECNDGLPSTLCDVVREAAASAAQKSYRIIDHAKVEAVLRKEPALRSCRREDCRVAITDALGAGKLVDVTIQGKGRGLTGTVSIYDPAAKGISGDTEILPTRREEGHVRRTVADAVDYVIGAQRLTATLRLAVQPDGALVKIDGQNRGTIREVRLFLGPHTVRVEKPGYLAVDQTVNVTPAGAALEVRLQLRPAQVRFEWYPPETRVLIDGDPVDARNPVVEVPVGRHRVQGLPPPGSGYASKDMEIEVTGDTVVKVVPQPLAQLRIVAPAGYQVRVDSERLPAGKSLSSTEEELLKAVTPGTHTVAATSWRNREVQLLTEAVAGNRTEVRLRPPPLWPGALLATVGLLAAAGGTALLLTDGRCIDAPIVAGVPCQYQYNLWREGAATVAVGGALLVGGLAWFGYNAANHPRFRPADRGAPRAARLAPSLYLGSSQGGLLVQGRF